MKTLMIICSLSVLLTIAWVGEPSINYAPEVKPTVEYEYVVTVQATQDTCPCAYEVWRMTILNGWNQNDWEVIYKQDDCEY